MTTDFNYKTTGTLEPIRNHVLVTDIDTEDEKIINGVIILSETGNDRGIKPRQAFVAAVGPDQEDIKAGDWVLVEHGRWTRGVKLSDGKVYRKVDPDCILIVSDGKINNSYQPNSASINVPHHNMGTR
jgi:co-chaperonin GroES (HSP10)